MIKKSSLLLLILVLSLPLFAISYEIVSLQSTINVDELGYFHIEENYVLNFHERAHGFYRTIPTRYDNNKVKVTQIKVDNKFSVSHQSNDVIIRIGDPDKYVIGEQNYKISYRYDLGYELQKSVEDLLFNIVGTDWDVPLNDVSFIFNMPEPVSTSSIEFAVGTKGSSGTKNLQWSHSGTRIIGAIPYLGPHEAISMKITLKEGYFKERTNWQSLLKAPSLLVSFLLIALAFYWWSRYGKDKDLIVVPNFTLLDEKSPLDVGYLIDQKLDPHDISAMIFYWADKGSLTIIESKKEVTFIKGEDPKASTQIETELFNAFFNSGDGSVVTLKELEKKFYKTYTKFKSKIDRYYSGKRSLNDYKGDLFASITVVLMIIPSIFYSLLLTANSVDVETFIIAIIGFGVSLVPTLMIWQYEKYWYLHSAFKKFFLIVALVIVVAVEFFVVTTITLFFTLLVEDVLFATTLLFGTNLILAFFASHTHRRSEYGHKMLENVLGLKEFIEKVEIGQLKKMIDENPQFYYKMLSYAIVLGLEKKWAKKFNTISLQQPSWYQGSDTLFTAVVMSNLLTKFNSSVAYSTGVSTSGGHSFGGGGSFSAGGGFGGGGGGAW
ncbi:MAG: DUF2207 domain-containing protein [Sphaerochaetaceae bacterium]|jgi:hypothetical protein